MDYLIGKTHAEIVFQHLDYASIIGQDHFNPSSIFKLLECVNLAGDSIFQKVGEKNGAIFRRDWKYLIKWQQIEFRSAFYDHKIEWENLLKVISEFFNRKTKLAIYHRPIKIRLNFLNIWQ